MPAPGLAAACAELTRTPAPPDFAKLDEALAGARARLEASESKEGVAFRNLQKDVERLRKQVKRVVESAESTVHWIAGKSDAGAERLKEAIAPCQHCCGGEADQIAGHELEVLKRLGACFNAVNPQEKGALAVNRGLRNAMLQAVVPLYSHAALKTTIKQGGPGWKVSRWSYKNIKHQLDKLPPNAREEACVLSMLQDQDVGGRNSKLTKEQEGEIQHEWREKHNCHRTPGIRGRKEDSYVVNGLLSEVVIRVQYVINEKRRKQGLQPLGKRIIRRHMPDSVHKPKRRTDMCHICLNGDRSIKQLRRYLLDLCRKYEGFRANGPVQRGEPRGLRFVDPTMPRRADEWIGVIDSVVAQGRLDHYELVWLAEYKEALLAVHMHHRAVEAQREEFKGQQIAASAHDSTSLVILLDFATIEIGLEYDEPDQKFYLRGASSVIGAAVWAKGGDRKKPIHYDVFSPTKDHSAFGAHNALVSILEDLKQDGRLEGVEELNVWSDNGGHFTAGIFAGACLAALPEHYGFKRASWNSNACYHGKTCWVDGGFSTIRKVLANHSLNPLNAEVGSARAAVGVMNEHRKHADAAYKKRGPYKALFCNFGKSAKVPYLYLEVPGHRSTYCIKMWQKSLSDIGLEEMVDGAATPGPERKRKKRKNMVNEDETHAEALQRWERYEWKDHGDSTLGRTGRVIEGPPVAVQREKEKKEREDVVFKRDINVKDVLDKAVHREVVGGMAEEAESIKTVWANLKTAKAKLEAIVQQHAERPKTLGDDPLAPPTTMYEARIALSAWEELPGAVRLRYTREKTTRCGAPVTCFGRLLRAMTTEECEDWAIEGGEGIFVFQQTCTEHVPAPASNYVSIWGAFGYHKGSILVAFWEQGMGEGAPGFAKVRSSRANPPHPPPRILGALFEHYGSIFAPVCPQAFVRRSGGVAVGGEGGRGVRRGDGIPIRCIGGHSSEGRVPAGPHRPEQDGVVRDDVRGPSSPLAGDPPPWPR